jgi:hypothetical protein
MLFFQNRAQDLAGPPSHQPSFSGQGAFLTAGIMYFHRCTMGGGADAGGTGCDSVNAYTNQLTLGGGSGSSAYVLGNIDVDELTLGGNSGINLDLSPSIKFPVLKATMLR